MSPSSSPHCCPASIPPYSGFPPHKAEAAVVAAAAAASSRAHCQGGAHTCSWQGQLSVVLASPLMSFTPLQTEKDALKGIDTCFLHFLLCIFMPQASSQDNAGSCKLLVPLAHKPSGSGSHSSTFPILITIQSHKSLWIGFYSGAQLLAIQLTEK